ncbi:MAG: prolipoprotein diacylglyceryl transferase [Gammaproteobacteria bacterium]|nr:prolipoprotein diacylglyceryl transferase [Gammaproteobacteria bacterium]
MIAFPDIDPIALQLGPIAVRWYGLSYLSGLLGAWWLLKRRAKKGTISLRPEAVDDLIFYATLGIVLGGRLGYVLFYNFSALLDDPLMIVRVWEGGMSFHGGFIGVIVAMAMFARRESLGWFEVTDAIAPVAPIGLGLGRLANFINGELWGRVSDVPWAMVFPGAGDLPRHPSQLYQMMLEGVLLFVVLNLIYKLSPARRVLSGAFLVGYGTARFVVEFFRQPDAHIGFVLANWMSMGQLLSLPMIVLGVVVIMMREKS